jgi:hypothetical protein
MAEAGRFLQGLEFDDATLRRHRDGVGPISDVQLQENGLEMSGRQYPQRGIGASRHRGLPAATTAGIVAMMPRSLSRYPDGAAGIALVLLRLACAWIACLVIARLPFPRFSPNASIVVSAAFALALTLGFG